jgi:hypothetical protein
MASWRYRERVAFDAPPPPSASQPVAIELGGRHAARGARPPGSFFNRPLDCPGVAGRDPDLSHVVLEPLAQVHLGPAELLDVHDPLASLPHDATNQIYRHAKGHRVVSILRIHTGAPLRPPATPRSDELASERHTAAGDINAFLACARPAIGVSHLDLHARRGLELGHDAA